MVLTAKSVLQRTEAFFASDPVQCQRLPRQEKLKLVKGLAVSLSDIWIE